jgi:hypothetical protein
MTTVEWHQARRVIRDPHELGDVTIEVGQTRDGDIWIAPLGTPPVTSYPPDDHWILLRGGTAHQDAMRDALLGTDR